MAFIEYVGVWMRGGRLGQMLNVAFSGVPNMLSRKAWPKGVPCLRMVLEPVQEPHIKEGIDSLSGVHHMLKGTCTYRTGRL